ncbi:MAG: efflux RND transporter periplasmic adaptor subunit [Rikenellaceae bacterium]|nr:efflux RND transporter periplasmic adaptor subunit [Rikenellaceae bacterium]
MRILTLFLVSVLVAACDYMPDKPLRPRVVRVETAQYARYVKKDFAGLSTADDATNLAFKIAGQVLSVPVVKGDSVAKGALLAVLDPRDVELQVEANRSAFEEARSRLERAKRLRDHDAVSQQEFESAQTRYSQARSAYDNSSDLLKDTRLRAPFAGVIERTYVDAFQRVTAGQTILRLVNPVSTTVGFTIPESSLPQLTRKTTTFSVRFDNIPEVEFAAEVKDYARTASDASGFPVSLRLLGVDRQRYHIIPGMSCTVTMRTIDELQDAVALPISAIYAPMSGGDYVWTVDSTDVVSLHRVRLGEIFDRDRVLVDSGVMPGSRVVVAGVYRLKEGEQVRVIR